MGASSSKSFPEEAAHLKRVYDEQFERELALQNILFVQRRALQLTERREQLSWETVAVGTITGVLLFAGSVYKRKDLVIPIVPLVMGLGWRYDSAYGNNQNTIAAAAEKLIKEKSQLIQPVGGFITLEEVDRIANSRK